MTALVKRIATQASEACDLVMDRIRGRLGTSRCWVHLADAYDRAASALIQGDPLEALRLAETALRHADVEDAREPEPAQEGAAT